MIIEKKPIEGGEQNLKTLIASIFSRLLMTIMKRKWWLSPVDDKLLYTFDVKLAYLLVGHDINTKKIP